MSARRTLLITELSSQYSYQHVTQCADAFLIATDGNKRLNQKKKETPNG